MKNIYSQIAEGLKEKKDLVLVTILDTKGSTPQIPGTSAIICEGRIWKGTLGGGILESEAQKKAKESILAKESVLFDYNLDDDITAAEGAICGGVATLLIDARPEKHVGVFNELGQSIRRKIPGVLVTIIERKADKRVSIERFWSTGESEITEQKVNDLGISEEVSGVLNERKARILSTTGAPSSSKKPDKLIFLEPIMPLPQLVIAGAGHIGQAIVHLGSLLEFEVTVIDDRTEFANRSRLPDCDIILVKDIGQAMKDLSITSDTYIVIVTRGHKHDAETLKPCIGSDAGYIGMIGSSGKVKHMRREFIEKGWATPEQFDRVHAPIGIDISSETIQEIAVSIAAQLVHVRHKNQESSPHISAIVLAAGESKRMVEPKLLLPYQGKTIIQNIVDTILQSKVNEVLVVLGAGKEKIKNALANLPVIFCTNRDYRKGMLSSIQKGCKALKEQTDACMIFLGDQPMITSEIIDELIKAYNQTKKGIVLPVFRGKHGHPVLIDKKYKTHIETLDPDIGLRDLIRKFPDDILDVEVNFDGILRDIDTKEDYINETAKID